MNIENGGEMDRTARTFQLLESFIHDTNIEACTDHEDMRIGSLMDEGNIIKAMIVKFGEENIKVPRTRHWYDVLFFGIPLAIKSSDFKKKASDNWSSKTAILWAFSNMSLEEFENSPQSRNLRHQDFQNYLRALRPKPSLDPVHANDIWILILDKGTGQLHLNSLMGLSKLTPNGNNLPFQICWAKNTVPVGRSISESYKFITDSYKESVRKKVSVHDGFESI